MATAPRAPLSRAALSLLHAAAARRVPLLLCPLAAAATILPAASGPPRRAMRCYSKQPVASSIRDSNPNWNSRPPKETILLDRCDIVHWLGSSWSRPTAVPPTLNPPDEVIDSYIKTLTQVVGSEEEARQNKLGFNMSLLRFWCSALVSEEFSYKIKELPKVRWVLPDSYLDVKNKDYGGKDNIFPDFSIDPSSFFCPTPAIIQIQD